MKCGVLLSVMVVIVASAVWQDIWAGRCRACEQHVSIVMPSLVRTGNVGIKWHTVLAKWGEENGMCRNALAVREGGREDEHASRVHICVILRLAISSLGYGGQKWAKARHA